MFSQAYTDRFPTTAAAIEAMVAALPPPPDDPAVVAAIQTEWKSRAPAEMTGETEFTAIWKQLGESEALLADRTSQGYLYLGINDEVRSIIGCIWATAFRQWPAGTQLSFLNRLCTTDCINPELAFEFAPPLFQEIRVEVDDLLRWVQQTRQQGAAQFPHHIHLSMQTFATAKPVEAVKLCALWLQSPLDEGTGNVLSRTIHWIRAAADVANPVARDDLAKLEQKLANSEESGHRALLLESWAFSAASPELTEAKACQLRDQLVTGQPDEARAWAYRTKSRVRL